MDSTAANPHSDSDYDRNVRSAPIRRPPPPRPPSSTAQAAASPPAFEFERNRNRPERYDRNLAENTLKAIKRIDKVREQREARHHKM